MDALILRGKKIKRNFRHSFKSYERFSISRNVRIFCNERGIFLFHHRFTIVSFSFFFSFHVYFFDIRRMGLEWVKGEGGFLSLLYFSSSNITARISFNFNESLKFVKRMNSNYIYGVFNFSSRKRLVLRMSLMLRNREGNTLHVVKIRGSCVECAIRRLYAKSNFYCR